MGKLKEPRERIMETSINLFSKKGFAAVGVREIARDAEVNISMISYYFGGKIGVLKAITAQYYQKIREISEESWKVSPDVSDFLRAFVKGIIKEVRNNTDLFRVAMIEMPFDHPEIIDFKIALMKDNMRFFKENFNGNPFMKNEEVHEKFHNKQLLLIIGPAIRWMIASHFLEIDLLKAKAGIEFNDEFYENYSETMSNLIIYGMEGVIKECAQKQSGN